MRNMFLDINPSNSIVAEYFFLYFVVNNEQKGARKACYRMKMRTNLLVIAILYIVVI